MKMTQQTSSCGCCLLLALIFSAPAANPPATLRGIARTVTVGPDSGDIKGNDNFALQRAADRLAAMAPEGRGLLKILPGTYTMFDSLHVRVPMTIRGEPGKTVLRKCPQFITTLVEPATVDTVDLKVKDPSGFKLGYGLTLRPEKEKTAWSPVMRTIVAIRDNTIGLDRPPRSEAVYGRPDRAYATGSVVQSSFPILAVRGVNDVEIEDLLVDGNLTENMEMYIDGCRNGAIYFHEGKDHAVRRCVFRANTIEDNGGLHPPGVGFDLNHPARGTVLEDNLVRDTRPAGQRSQTIALRLHPKSEPAKVADSNRFEGAVQKEETQDR